jgi:hypothetical protein
MNDLLGYLLKLDEPEDRQRIEACLRDDPEAVRMLAVLEKAVAPLEADREQPLPTEHLVSRTIGRVAGMACKQESPRPEVLAGPAAEPLMNGMTSVRLRKLSAALDRANAPPSRWRPTDMIVVASIVLVGLGLVISAVPMIRQRSQMQACQNQLRQFHGALETYADTHGDDYPKVTDTPAPGLTVASVVPMLKQAGALPDSAVAGCPGVIAPNFSDYAYTLGYRDEAGELNGLRREPWVRGWEQLPIAADQPSFDCSPPSPVHQNGQNVLFCGGNVRFCTISTVGYEGDDIYVNKAGEVRAGIGMWDTVLGVGSDRP